MRHVNVRSLNDELEAHKMILRAIEGTRSPIRELHLTLGYMALPWDSSLPVFAALTAAVAGQAASLEVAAISHQIWSPRLDVDYNMVWVELPRVRSLVLDLPERMAVLRRSPSPLLPSLQHLTLRNANMHWALTSLFPNCPSTMTQLTLTFDTRYKHYSTGMPIHTRSLPPHITHVRVYVDTVEPELALLPLPYLSSSSATHCQYAISLSPYELDGEEGMQHEWWHEHIAPLLAEEGFMAKLNVLDLHLRRFDGRPRINMLTERDARYRVLKKKMAERGIEVRLLAELGDLDRQANPL